MCVSLWPGLAWHCGMTTCWLREGACLVWHAAQGSLQLYLGTGRQLSSRSAVPYERNIHLTEGHLHAPLRWCAGRTPGKQWLTPVQTGPCPHGGSCSFPSRPPCPALLVVENSSSISLFSPLSPVSPSPMWRGANGPEEHWPSPGRRGHETAWQTVGLCALCIALANMALPGPSTVQQQQWTVSFLFLFCADKHETFRHGWATPGWTILPLRQMGLCAVPGNK